MSKLPYDYYFQPNESRSEYLSRIFGLATSLFTGSFLGCLFSIAPAVFLSAILGFLISFEYGNWHLNWHRNNIALHWIRDITNTP